VKLNDDAKGATVRNVAAPTTVGGACAQGACETTAYTTSWTLAKTSDPGSGATVEPGDRITYTLRVTNTGPTTLTGAVVDDDMSDLLDDATLGELPSGTSLDHYHLTWLVPSVPVGESTEIHYTATVRANAYGVTLGNVAYGDGAAACASGALEPIGAAVTSDCQTAHYTPGWTLEKTSDPADGSTVVPGSDVTYTLRVQNTSRAVVSHAVVTDDLSDVLAYATLGVLPDDATLTGRVLTWTVPTLQPGEEATVSYTVTVRDDDEAYNGHFTNTAVPSAGGFCEETCTSSLTTSPAAVDPIHTGGGGSHGSSSTSGSTGSSTLAYTGFDLGILGVAGVALAAGLGLLAAARKRRSEEG
jgi:uncharacterized repeat protein (TIGR01451 family)/fimbrial isopeptide formation D2 family protein